MITLHNATLDKKILSQNEHGKESPSMWISACFLIWQLVFAVLPQVLHDQMSPSLITSSSTACFASAYEESFSYTATAMVFSVGCFLIFLTDFLTSVLFCFIYSSESSICVAIFRFSCFTVFSIFSVSAPYKPTILSLLAI